MGGGKESSHKHNQVSLASCMIGYADTSQPSKAGVGLDVEQMLEVVASDMEFFRALKKLAPKWRLPTRIFG